MTSHSTRSDEKVRAAALSALAEGYPGVALRRLDPQPILEPEAAYKPLCALHPPEKEHREISPTHLKDSLINEELAVKITRLMPTLSAPGPSGLRASHLRALLSSSHDLNPLARVLTQIANGQAPSWLRNARLIVIAKNTGRVRPIAIGEVLRRLTASCVNELFVNNNEDMPRNQLCLVRDGVLIGAYVTSSSIAQGKSVAALDTSNAFNSLSRETC